MVGTGSTCSHSSITMVMKRKRVYAPSSNKKAKGLVKAPTKAGTVARVRAFRPKFMPLQSLNSMGRSIFGRSLRVTMPYFESGLTIPTNGVISGLATAYTFRVNSLYDPDYTGTGHQPLGYDQLAPMYKQNVVHACRIKVGVRNYSTDLLIAGIHISRNPTISPYNMKSLIESGPGCFTVLGVGSTSGSLAPDTTCRQELEYDVNISDFMANRAITADDNLRAAEGANPATIIYAHVIIAKSTAFTYNSDTALDYVLMEFDAEFIEPIPLATS